MSIVTIPKDGLTCVALDAMKAVDYTGTGSDITKEGWTLVVLVE